MFDRHKIEDMWLNYYCVTTDLTSHTERVHVNGTASRYIRASMSLANFLPPLCDLDPNDKKCHYLVDGGYVNTVPIDGELWRLLEPTVPCYNILLFSLVHDSDAESFWGQDNYCRGCQW